jgi:hypothetical protein
MYQFTTTNIINSATDSNGTTAKYAGSTAALKVARVGTFLTDKIVSIYKRPYQAGVKEVAQATVPTITAGLVARVAIDVRLAEQTNSEYASTHLYFSKPVYVEVIATGTAATDATNLKNELNKLKDRYGFSYVTATTSSADLIITATDVNQRIKSIKIYKESGTTGNSIIEPSYEDVTSTTFSVTTAGKSGFGTDAWMAQKIVIPTLERARTFGISQDERPIIGGNYSQYTLRYSIDKDGTDGIVGGGKSITTHVFYVLSTLVSAFETELGKLSISVPNLLSVAGATTTTLSTGDDDTVQLVVKGAVGAVTYASDQPTRATVDANGLVTTEDVTATGAVVITVTDSVGNTATISITVEA